MSGSKWKSLTRKEKKPIPTKTSSQPKVQLRTWHATVCGDTKTPSGDTKLPRKVKDYCLLEADSFDRLGPAVRDRVSEGWQPYGSLLYYRIDNSVRTKDCFVREMVKYDDAQKEDPTLKRLKEWHALSDQGLRLRCGELTAQEVRTVRAVLNSIAEGRQS